MLAEDPGRYRVATASSGPDCAGATDVGPVRSRNEDAYWIAPDGSVLAVADGLGGLPAGDVASSLAVDAVARFFGYGAPGGSSSNGGQAPPPELAQKPAQNPAMNLSQDLTELVRAAADRAQRAVLQAAMTQPTLRGMATTLVIALIRGDTASVLHIGDSRAGLWRDGEILHVTLDQNSAGDLLRSGQITAEQARVHPGRHLVREVVGLPGGFEAECQTWKLEAGDAIVLYTDGVSDPVGEAQIARLLDSAPDAATAASAIVEVAGLASGHDNATAIVRYIGRR